MTTPDIGRVASDGIEEYFRHLAVPFGWPITDDDLAAAPRFWDPDWLGVARVDGRIVGTYGSFPLHLRMPGGATVPTAGTTTVSVQPTHRRRGVLSAMLRHHFAEALDRGQPMAALWASEATIYGRFGYGVAAQELDHTIPHHRATLQPVEDDTEHDARFIDVEEATTVLPAVFDAALAERPGSFRRWDGWWSERVLHDPPHRRAGGTAQRIVVVSRDGRDVGYARWRTAEDPAGDFRRTLRVAEVRGVDAPAERAVWAFLVGIDLVSTISVGRRPFDDPLPWWLVDRRGATTTVSDSLWVRPLDVARCLEARAYAVDGTVILAVEDPFGPTGNGTWRLAVTDGQATCEAAGPARPDATVSIAGLGSLLMGGASAPVLAATGDLVAEPAVVADLHRRFAWPIAPYVQDVF